MFPTPTALPKAVTTNSKCSTAKLTDTAILSVSGNGFFMLSAAKTTLLNKLQ